MCNIMGIRRERSWVDGWEGKVARIFYLICYWKNSILGDEQWDRWCCVICLGGC